jgi:DNA-binding transcriptional LysR family regulator
VQLTPKIHNNPQPMSIRHDLVAISMNLRQLRAVQGVAELGSVTAAANRLGLTQSGVSRMIGALEAELGVALFDRRRRRLVLTEHALGLLQRAEKIVRDVQELEASARAARQGRVERLRLISVPPFLHEVVPTAVARRLNANPRLSVRVDIARRADIPDSINRREFDIAIVGLPVDRPEVNIAPLPPVAAVAMLPRRHRLAKKKRVRVEDLLEEPVVAHSSGPLMRFELDRALATHGLRLAPAVEAPNAWIVHAMVAAGAGVAIVDPFTASAQSSTEPAVRPLTRKIVLRYGIMTLRERPLAGESAALAQEIEHQVAMTLRRMRVQQ